VSGDHGNLLPVIETAVPVTTSTLKTSLAMPAQIASAGDRASRRFLEFSAVSIANDKTAWPITGPVCGVIIRVQ
jgi:hypothetical protein